MGSKIKAIKSTGVFDETTEEDLSEFQHFFDVKPLTGEVQKKTATPSTLEGEKAAESDGGGVSHTDAGRAMADAPRRRGRPRKEAIGAGVNSGTIDTASEGAKERFNMYWEKALLDKARMYCLTRGYKLSNYLMDIISPTVEKDYETISAEDLGTIARYRELVARNKK